MGPSTVTGELWQSEFALDFEVFVRRPLSVVRRKEPRTTDHGPRTCHGFTLLELMIVCTIILILMGMALPMMHTAVVHAKEAVLRDDLYTMRKLIDQYTLDKQHPPESLDDLVEAGYLRGGIPNDPFTGRNDTWKVDTEDVPSGPDQTANGIVDVHSGSEETSPFDGTAYNTW
jgi:general secretion pathway protein G